MEVWKRFWVGRRAGRCGYAEGFQGRDWCDPGGDGCGEAFGQERTEGLVLPRLDVAGRPVVEEADAKDVICGFGDWDRRAEEAGFANVKRQFQFVV